MSIIIKIHSINPSGSISLGNRLDPENKKPSGKTYLPKVNVRFDEYLDAQLKDKNFASRFKKAGQSEAIVPEESSTVLTAPFFSLTLNDIVPELHIPFNTTF